MQKKNQPSGLQAALMKGLGREGYKLEPRDEGPAVLSASPALEDGAPASMEVIAVLSPVSTRP